MFVAIAHFLTMQYIEKNSVLCFHPQRFQSVIVADNSLDCQYVFGRMSGKPVQPHSTGPGGLTGSLLVLLGAVSPQQGSNKCKLSGQALKAQAALFNPLQNTIWWVAQKACSEI